MKKNIPNRLLLIMSIVVILYFIVKVIIIINFNNKFNSMGDIPIEEKNIYTINLEENQYYKFKTIKIKNCFENYTTYNERENGIGLNDNNQRRIYITSNIVDFIESYNSENINNFKKNGLKNKIDLYKKFKNKERVHLFTFSDKLIDSISLYDSIDVKSYFDTNSKYKLERIELGKIDENDYILYIENNIDFISIYKNNKIKYVIYFLNFEESDVYNLIETIKLD